MHQERFWELTSLKLAGEATQDELAELETFLREHPEEGLRLEKLDIIWNATRKGNTVSRKEAFNRHMQRLSNHLSEPVLQYEAADDEEMMVQEEMHPVPVKRFRKLLWMSSIAASLLLAFFIYTNVRTGRDKIKPTAHNTISTKRGSKSNVHLPDGTQVWLNADSKITYNENFLGSIREVELTGEAFFDVVRDETRPFIIHTRAIDVKVLGTAFNVRSYEDEKSTETSLIRGSVEITLVNSPDKKKIILKPNDKLIVNNNEMAIMQKENESKTNIPVMTLAKINYQKKDSSAMETLWVKNKLAFDGETVEDIALKIERWYDVKVSIGNDKLRKVKFSGIFEDENLQQVMEALELAGIPSTINKKEVIFGQ